MFGKLIKKGGQSEEFNIEKYFNEAALKDKKVPIIFFYEEIPISEKIKIREFNKDAKTILLEPEKKLVKALMEITDVYFKLRHNDKNIFLKSKIIYGSEKGVEITLPEPVEDDRIFRFYLRVKTSDRKPVFVEIMERDDENKKEEKKKLKIKGKAKDISETGIGVILKKEDYQKDKNLENFVENIKEDDIYNLKIHLPHTTVETKGLIVKTIDEEKYKKLGITFVDIDLDSREEIFKYIFERQKEILKELNEDAY